MVLLDPGKSDHPLATVGVVAKTPCDMASNLYLHTGLVEVDIAVAVQLKAHHVLHNPMKALRYADRKVRPQKRFVRYGKNGCEPVVLRNNPDPRRYCGGVAAGCGCPSS
jgi:hypothetical protein